MITQQNRLIPYECLLSCVTDERDVNELIQEENLLEQTETPPETREEGISPILLVAKASKVDKARAARLIATRLFNPTIIALFLPSAAQYQVRRQRYVPRSR